MHISALDIALRQVTQGEPADQEEGHFIPVRQDRRPEPLSAHEGDEAVKEGREEQQSSQGLRKAAPGPLSRGEQEKEPELERGTRENVTGSRVDAAHGLTQRRRGPVVAPLARDCAARRSGRPRGAPRFSPLMSFSQISVSIGHSAMPARQVASTSARLAAHRRSRTAGKGETRLRSQCESLRQRDVGTKPTTCSRADERKARAHVPGLKG